MDEVSCLFIKSAGGKEGEFFFRGPGWYYINKFHQIKGPCKTRKEAEERGHNDNNLSHVE